MLFIILTVWLAVSLVFLLGLARAARHPSHEPEAHIAEESHSPGCTPDLMSPKPAVSHHSS